MNVCLLDPRLIVATCDHQARSVHDQIVRCAEAAVPPSKHRLVASPAEADLVLLGLNTMAFGPFFETVRGHPLIRGIRDKLVVYSPIDLPLPTLRGLYPAVSRKWIEAGRALPLHYVDSHIPSLGIREDELNGKDIACSFVGSSHTHPIRKAILQQNFGDKVYLFDSCGDPTQGWWWARDNAAQLREHFRDVLVRSRFVLCPRGVSPSSIRLFEAMEAAAVPVIVSDEIQLPEGPDWPTFCIRVKEAELATIPAAVEKWSGSALARGLAAREAWKAHFSVEATFDYMVAAAARLLSIKPGKPLEVLWEQYADRYHLKEKLKYWASRWR